MFDKVSTPLRYPGGKSVMTEFISNFLHANQVKSPIYAEPYCGGAGAAVNLLITGQVEEIYLNDADYSIFSFWKSMCSCGESFLSLLEKTPVSIQEWHIQKAILKNKNNKTSSKEDILANGFATFYLNRCNRSGILNAGPIGGQKEESQINAKYKIDARFNKETLRSKIERIISYNNKIHVYNLDAISFLNNIIGRLSVQSQQNCVVYLDPPYYKQGSSLYLNYYEHDDHSIIATYLEEPKEWKWLLSYDNTVAIRNLYTSYTQHLFYINYSAQTSKMGSELLIHSKNSQLPLDLLIRRMKTEKREMKLLRV